MFGSLWKSKEEKVTQCAEDLTNMFPNFLDVAKGRNGTNKVPDCVAHHPEILGFLYGFSSTVTIYGSSLANVLSESAAVCKNSKKLGFETQKQIIYQAICNILNRPDDFETIKYWITFFDFVQNNKFANYKKQGFNFSLNLAVGSVWGGDEYDESNTLKEDLQRKVCTIIKENDALLQDP